MSISFNQLRRLGLLAVLIVSVVVISGGDAIAVDIPAGYDDYIILPSSTVTFTGTHIPADFFAPGSDPFVRTVGLEGDTIIERLNDANFSGGPPETTIPIELVSLNLVSIAPITVTFNGGFDPELWDLSVLLPGPPTGSMTVTKLDPNGGTFDSVLSVQPDFIFTRIDPPLSFMQYPVLGTFDLTSTGDPWSNQNPNVVPPNTSNFYPGGTPGDQSIAPEIITLSGGGMQLDLVLVPEPATLSLLALGGLAVSRRGRKKENSQRL